MLFGFHSTIHIAQGGRFEHGFYSGFISSMGLGALSTWGGDVSAEGYMVVGAAVGGTAEALGGGKFANGAITGAYVGLFNHAMHQGQSHKVSELEYPPSVDLRSDNWEEQIFAWITFIEENNLHHISIGRIINFYSLNAGVKSSGARYYGSKKYGDGYIEWNTLGLPNEDNRSLSGVIPAALSDGEGGLLDYSFIFEGYQISGNSPPINLFQIRFSNHATFQKASYQIYGKDITPWIREVR